MQKKQKNIESGKLIFGPAKHLFSVLILGILLSSACKLSIGNDNVSSKFNSTSESDSTKKMLLGAINKPKIDDLIEGICTNIGANPFGSPSEVMTAISGNGDIKWARLGVKWGSVEKDDALGVPIYNFDAPQSGPENGTGTDSKRSVDDWAAAAKNANMGIVFTFAAGDGLGKYGNQGRRQDAGNTPVPYNETGEEAFANFAAHVIKRVISPKSSGGLNFQKVIFELFNEPNSPAYWPLPKNFSTVQYQEAAESYASIAKKIRFKCDSMGIDPFLMGPGLAQNFRKENGSAATWMGFVKAAGGFNVLDAVTIHFYEKPGFVLNDTLITDSNYPENVIRQIDYWKSFAGKKPIISSEWGYPVGPLGESIAGNPDVTPREQAAFLSRSLLIFLSEKVPFHNIFCWDIFDNESKPVYRFEIHDKDSTKNALRLFRKYFAGYQFVTDSIVSGKFYNYIFRNSNNKSILAVWNMTGDTVKSVFLPGSNQWIKMNSVTGDASLVNAGTYPNTQVSITPIYFIEQ